MDSEEDFEAEVPICFKEERLSEAKTRECALDDPKDMGLDVSPSFCSSIGADPGSLQETAEDADSSFACRADAAEAPETGFVQEEEESAEPAPCPPAILQDPAATSSQRHGERPDQLFSSCHVACVEQPAYGGAKRHSEAGTDLAAAVDLLVSHPQFAAEPAAEPDDFYDSSSTCHDVARMVLTPYPQIPESDMPLPAFPGRSRAQPAERDLFDLQLQPYGSAYDSAFILNARLADEMAAPPCMFGRSHVNILACPNFLHGLRARCGSTLARAVSPRPLLTHPRHLALPAVSRMHKPDPAPNFMVLIGRGHCANTKPATDSGIDFVVPTRSSRASSASRSSEFWETSSTESMSPRLHLPAQDLQKACESSDDLQAGWHGSCRDYCHHPVFVF